MKQVIIGYTKNLIEFYHLLCKSKGQRGKNIIKQHKIILIRVTDIVDQYIFSVLFLLFPYNFKNDCLTKF